MFSLLSLIDDIASTLDDIATMTKVALQETSVLMSDDLAVNTGVVHGVTAHQELPMVWKIFVGSLLNKVYSIIGVLVLMALYPPVLKIILFIGGLYLSYEGAHKVVEKIFDKQKHKQKERNKINPEQKIKQAVRTDLILSVEIIVIAQNSMQASLFEQTISLMLVGLAASIIIYGLVGVLVKVDDFGVILIERNYKKIGFTLVKSMPYMMKALGVIGTVAMFLVGGGIISHTFHLSFLNIEMIQNLIIGMLAGLFVLLVTVLYKKLQNK